MEKDTNALLSEFFEFTKLQFEKTGEQFGAFKTQQEKFGTRLDTLTGQVLLLNDGVKSVTEIQNTLVEQLDDVHTDVRALAVDLRKHSQRVIAIDNRLSILESKT